MRRLCPCQGSMRVELVSGARVFDRVIETTQRDKLRIAGVGGGLRVCVIERADEQHGGVHATGFDSEGVPDLVEPGLGVRIV